MPSRTFRISRRGGHQDFVLVVLALAPMLILAIAVAQFSDRTWEALLARRSTVLVLALVAVMVPVSVWAQLRFIRRGRLTVDDAGIALDSGLPAWLGRAHRIAWNEVRKVAVIESMSMVQVRKAGLGRPIALRIPMWVPEDTPDEVAPKAGLFSRPDIRATTLWKTLDAHGLFAPERRDAGHEAVNFDLGRHPATRAALAVMAALAAYWALDCYAGTEAWAEWRSRYLVGPAVLGVLGALAGFAALRSASAGRPIPLQVQVPIAVLLGLCVALASWPGLVRLNQVAGGPLEPHAYTVNASCDTLVPVEPGLPPIEYTGQARAYWCSLPKGQQHQVLVRRGLGGLYQVDLSQHTQAIRRFRARAGP